LTTHVYKLLQAADWDNIGKELLAFAVSRARNYYWARGGPNEWPKGNKPEDIVQLVIEKTIKGQRKWDPAKGLLKPWLIDQVKSEIDALFKSAMARREAFSLDDDETDHLDEVPHRDTVHVSTASSDPTPEETVLRKEEEELASKRVSSLFAATADDPEVEQVLTAIMNGCEPKPQEIAKELNTSTEDINNRMKRLRRHALKTREEPENGQAKVSRNK